MPPENPTQSPCPEVFKDAIWLPFAGVCEQGDEGEGYEVFVLVEGIRDTKNLVVLPDRRVKGDELGSHPLIPFRRAKTDGDGVLLVMAASDAGSLAPSGCESWRGRSIGWPSLPLRTPRFDAQLDPRHHELAERMVESTTVVQRLMAGETQRHPLTR